VIENTGLNAKVQLNLGLDSVTKHHKSLQNLHAVYSLVLSRPMSRSRVLLYLVTAALGDAAITRQLGLVASLVIRTLPTRQSAFVSRRCKTRPPC